MTDEDQDILDMLGAPASEITPECHVILNIVSMTMGKWTPDEVMDLYYAIQVAEGSLDDDGPELTLVPGAH